MKISPQKVGILLEDAEVYGLRICKGRVLPSPHIVDNLGKVQCEDITTVKQLNSWRGLYKTLIGHIPHLAVFMEPFKAASAHLDKINETFLPRPTDQLILKPDSAQVKTCTGWVLYASRGSNENKQLLPVQFCTAKRPTYMSKWYPCEVEAVGAVLAIDQAAHWINESNKPTIVMPDSMPVVKAANLMRQGKHSKNPRLQSLMACVNR